MPIKNTLVKLLSVVTESEDNFQTLKEYVHSTDSEVLIIVNSREEGVLLQVSPKNFIVLKDASDLDISMAVSKKYPVVITTHALKTLLAGSLCTNYVSSYKRLNIDSGVAYNVVCNPPVDKAQLLVELSELNKKAFETHEVYYL